MMRKSSNFRTCALKIDKNTPNNAILGEKKFDTLFSLYQTYYFLCVRLPMLIQFAYIP